jgi:LysM repeat protein
MRRFGIFLAASAALNIVLVALLLSPAHQNSPAGTEADPPPPASNGAGVKPQVVVRKQFFSWSELESPEYPVYISRLREIGCPEQTVRDIVIADVNQMFARRRAAEIPEPAQEWWRSEPGTNFLATATAKMQALEQERRALLTRLLGPDWASGGSPRTSLALNGPVLGELTPESRQAVQDIVTRALQRAQAYTNGLDGKPVDRAELARYEQQMRGELAKILTPAQLEEFLLRYSASADGLRNQLRGFQVTPDEFRKIFRVSDPLNQQIQLLSGSDAGSVAGRAALEKELQDAIKDALGPDRYQAYQLSKDPAYRDALALAQQAGASTNLVPGLYRLTQAFRQEQDRIRNDPNLTPEQKAEQLKNLDQQQQAMSNQLLGLATPDNQPVPATPPIPPVTPIVDVHAYSPGETVDQIAAKYGITSSDLMNANSNVNFNGLTRGTPINIPAKH